MSKYRFLTLPFTIAVLLLSTGLLRAQTQGKILFESWINVSQPCPDGTRPQYESDLSGVTSSKANKIIWLNQHIPVVGFDDPMTQGGAGVAAGSTQQRLLNVNDGKAYLYYASVNRTDWGSGRASVDGTDWGGEIDQAGSTPPATITFDSGTLDITPFQDPVLSADIDVEAKTTITDNISIFYAILQDNLYITPNGLCTTNPGAEKTGPYNSVLRYLTNRADGHEKGVPVFVGGASSGTKKTLHFSTIVHLNPNILGDTISQFSNMRLVAFIEQQSGTDYKVVNAVELVKNLHSLPAPRPSLSLDETGLNDSTFKAGEHIKIYFDASHVQFGVHPYYSLDNGSTWIPITDVDSTDSPFSWTVPDTTTTQGKIKIVAVDDNSVTSVESGTFSIVIGKSVAWINPDPSKPDTATANTPITLQWSNHGVSAVKVEWSYHVVSGTPKWNTIVDNFSGTSYPWTTRDTSWFVDLRLVPVNGEAAAQLTQLTLIKSSIPNGVKNVSAATNFTVRDIYPNPTTPTKNMVLDYTSAKPKLLFIEVLDLLGHSLYSQSAMSSPTGHFKIPTSDMTAGTYFVRLSDGEQAITKRIEILK